MGKAGKGLLAAVAAAHALAIAGALHGGWLLGVAADGWWLLCCLDAALFAASALMGSRGGAWGFGALGAAFAVAFAAFPYQPWAKAPEGGRGEERAGAWSGKAAHVTLLQGNAEAKGNPAGWDYDVVALSEAPGEPLRPPAGMRLAAGMDGRSDAAIWTRLPVLDSGSVESGPGWRQAVWARVRTSAGPVMIISVHTRSPTSRDWSERRDAFFVELEGFLKRQRPFEPVVLAGDFNATPQTLSFRRLLSSRAFEQEPNPYAPTWSAKAARWGLGFRIDRTLGSNGAKIVAWRRLPLADSDHLFSESVLQIPRQR